MNKHFLGLFILLFAFPFQLVFAKGLNVEGYWRTYDLSGTPRSIVRFTAKSGTLTGYIVRVLSGHNDGHLCHACKGRWHNKPLVGLPIIWGLRREGNQWVNGYVLNIDNGKIYRCNISVSEDNNIMHFTAYVGTPMFGKTLNWARVR